MTDLTKDEVVKMAREAGFSQDWQFAVPPSTLSNFATLCRAPLVAEVERLKDKLDSSVHGHNQIFELSKILKAERDTLKARAEEAEAELARVRAGKPVAYIAWKNDKPCYEGDDAICEDAVWPVDSDDYRTSMPVFTAPQPAAQEPDCATTGVCVRSGLYASPPSAVPVVRQMVVALDLAAPYFTHNNQVTAAIAAGRQYLKENGK